MAFAIGLESSSPIAKELPAGSRQARQASCHEAQTAGKWNKNRLAWVPSCTAMVFLRKHGCARCWRVLSHQCAVLDKYTVTCVPTNNTSDTKKTPVACDFRADPLGAVTEILAFGDVGAFGDVCDRVRFKNP